MSNELLIRQEFVKDLKEYHPGQIKKVDDRAAHYTGGMADNGGLNYQWLYEEATTEEINTIIRKLNKNYG